MASIQELCHILILIFIFYLTSTAITAQGLNHKHDAYPNLIKMLDGSPTISPSQPRNVTFHLPPAPQISPTKVPALFVIGDSSVDCGTNNFLGTFARADRLPYGKDFDTHQPTGRFCNGRIPVDYIGNFLLIFFLDFWLGFLDDLMEFKGIEIMGCFVFYFLGVETGWFNFIIFSIQLVSLI